MADRMHRRSPLTRPLSFDLGVDCHNGPRDERGAIACYRWLTALSFTALIPVLVAACATSKVAAVEDVPAPLMAPPSQILSSQLRASGVQIYGCKASKDDSTRFEWVLVSPEAELMDRTGKAVGRHYAGPTWEASDGSKVVGAVVGRDNGPDPSAIPWLLLRATSTSGHGMFSSTQSVQRLHTVGGKAPADGCDQTREGKQVQVPYQADYLFYSQRQ